MSKRIVILGANGFLGGWIHKRFTEENPEQVQGFSSRECDLLLPESIERALGGLTGRDVVVMAAAVTRLKANNFEAMVSNLRMVENLSGFLSRHLVDQVVYLSSVDVYGCLERNWNRKSVPIREDFAILPDDDYGTGKYAAERILTNRLKNKGVAVGILRLPGVFGPCDEGTSLVGRFLRAGMAGEKIVIYGDGQDRRDYVYVQDVYAAVSKAIEVRLNDSVNVVSGQSFSILEIVKAIEESLAVSCEVIFKPVSQPELERIKNMTFDDQYVRKVLPGLNVHDLKWGIRQYLTALNCSKKN